MQVEGTMLAVRLRALVDAAVAGSSAKGILLSGGLDTSILSSVAVRQGMKLQAYMVAVAESPSPDEPFAQLMAERCGLVLLILRPTLKDLIEVMPEVMGVLRTFDPMDLRNSAVTWMALRAAAEEGIDSVLTGDAADELFAGYSYIFNMPPENVPKYTRFINGVMSFTSQEMAVALGSRAILPYLDPAIREVALTLNAGDVVGERDGKRFGKKILREAFASLLPPEVTWRVKTPIEFGSGSCELQKFATDLVTDGEFEAERNRAEIEDGVKLRDKEQCFYYRIYRRTFSAPREQGGGESRCRACAGPLPRWDSSYCRICGAYPA